MTVISNLEKYKKDLDDLITDGHLLLAAMRFERQPVDTEKAYKKAYGEKYEGFRKLVPAFQQAYQTWYSEAKSIIKLLLPDRLADFIKLFEKPKTRKDISYENYVVEDYLIGLNVTRGWEKETVVNPDAAIPKFEQQLNILTAVKKRFESSLFDIKQLVQADLFDTELEAAEELSKKKFNRAAGALAGVVLEKHLRQVCDNHNLSTTKKHPTISIYSEMLKEANVIDIPQWRGISHLADIRNLCDHPNREPTDDEISDLIKQVSKLLKTLY